MSEHEALREQLAATERRLAVARARRDAAEAKVARVEALADEWDDRAEMWDQEPYFARDLRAALSAPQPADAPEGHGDADEAAGCDCAVLCGMGPTCPGGMLARLPGSGCWRTEGDR